MFENLEHLKMFIYIYIYTVESERYRCIIDIYIDTFYRMEIPQFIRGILVPGTEGLKIILALCPFSSINGALHRRIFYMVSRVREREQLYSVVVQKTTVFSPLSLTLESMKTGARSYLLPQE